MENSEYLYGQTQRSAHILFDFILRVFFSKYIQSQFLEFVESVSSQSQAYEFFCIKESEIATRHAMLAHRVLTADALAFLTDEQKEDLQKDSAELQEHWHMIIESFGEYFTEPCSDDVKRRIDAVFLSQMEWMHDVKFDACALDVRVSIFPESPVAQIIF